MAQSITIEALEPGKFTGKKVAIPVPDSLTNRSVQEEKLKEIGDFQKILNPNLEYRLTIQYFNEISQTWPDIAEYRTSDQKFIRL